MVETNCPRCNKLSEGIEESLKAFKHCQRTLDVIVKNKENPKIVVQSALDTMTYLYTTIKELRELKVRE